MQAVQYLSTVMDHDVDKLKIAAMKTLMEMLQELCSDSDFLITGVKKLVSIVP